MIVIFGASGFIGSHLFKYYQTNNIPVIGTYFRNKEADLIPFDIARVSKSNFSFLNERVKFGVISIKAGPIDYYKTHQEECLKIKQGIKKLIDILCEYKIKPVFLSTNYVFEGILGNYKEEDFPNPTTQYGRSKLEIENYIKAKTKDYIIVRTEHVYGFTPGDGTLIISIVEKLLRGEQVTASYDQLISPTSVYDVIKGIVMLIKHNANGIFHIASPRVVTRYGIAKFIKSRIPKCKGEIVRCSIDDLKFKDTRPKNATLNSQKIKKIFNMRYSSLEEDIYKIIDLYKG